MSTFDKWEAAVTSVVLIHLSPKNDQDFITEWPGVYFLGLSFLLSIADTANASDSEKHND